MHDPKEQEPVRHPYLGAAPALVGTIPVLVHLREPVVPRDYQGFLFALWVVCVCWSLAAWIYCGIDRSRRQLEDIAESLRSISSEIEVVERQERALGEAFIESDPRDRHWPRSDLGHTASGPGLVGTRPRGRFTCAQKAGIGQEIPVLLSHW